MRIRWERGVNLTPTNNRQPSSSPEECTVHGKEVTNYNSTIANSSTRGARCFRQKRSDRNVLTEAFSVICVWPDETVKTVNYKVLVRAVSSAIQIAFRAPITGARYLAHL